MTDADEASIGLRVPSDVSDTPVAERAPSVGQQLQRARVRAGLSLEILSGRLKVSVSRLQAFENDEFEQGPNVHIGRAMVASVARFLGLDAQALLAQMPQPQPMGLAPAANEAATSLRKQTRLSMRRGARDPVSPVWWLALALLVVTGLLYFYPNITQWTVRPGAAVSQDAATLAPSPPVPALSAELVASAASAAPPSLPSDAPASGTPREAGASVAKAGQPLLFFKARGSTWIEVSDGKGVVLLRRTLAAAETAEAGGELPLSVVIGRADHTEVMVRGAPFALETHTQDNVARFKVP